MKQQEQLRRDTQFSLLERDYNLLEQHHARILNEIERSIDGGCSAATILRWAREIVTESEILQRIENTAKYLEWLRDG
jgi:hypothetical protein